MPKQSYGAVPKGRSQSLLFALLDFANDSLNGDEVTIERLHSQIEIHWQTATRLVVRTKLRYLQTLNRLANPAQPLTLPQIKIALKHLAEHLGILEDNRTITRGSEDWHFTLNFWGDRWERDYNLTRFEAAWTDQNSSLITDSQKRVDADQKIGDRWQEICRDTLNTCLTSNPLTAGDGMMFELEDLYVPLGVRESLVAEDKTGDDVELKSYEPQDLLEQCLQQKTNKNKHIRIAIIGEPGAGKSTFLQQFALSLIEANSPPKYLPLWISLADLEGRSLEEYLTTTWLKQAFKTFTIVPKILTEFTTLIESGWVWLLLDALDEMGEQHSSIATKLERELQGWLGNAPVILTCRSSLWEAGKNALAYFHLYRCQSFNDNQLSGVNQVELFIQKWFKAQPDLGDRLITELDRRVNFRIRDVARHPLYLVLLCRTWQLTQGKLPSTKSILYRQFVDRFYDWKQEAFPTTRSQRRSLNQALGSLALLGMHKNPASFRFKEGEIQTHFDTSNPDLLTLALQLGWLVAVGHSEATGEKVYSFYHPTFQEYFAAAAIAHGQELICFNDHQRNVYPIFESSWQEIILLWLGREDLDLQEKESFLQTLWQWQDHCGGFYDLRAICLVGKSLAEFPNFSQAKTVVNQLVQWRFANPQDSPTLPVPMVEQAGIALSRSDRQLTIPALEAFLQTSQDPFEQWLAAHSLGKNHDMGNPTAIATLEHVLETDLNVLFKLNICRSLGAINPKNEQVLSTLKQIIATESKINLRRKAALRLGKLDPQNSLAIQTLEILLQEAIEPHQRSNILDSLREIAPNHPLVLEISVDKNILPAIKSNSHRSRPKTDQERQLAATTILQKLAITIPKHQGIYLLSKLAIYDPENPILLPSLLEALGTEHRKSSLKLVTETLDLLVELKGDRLSEVFPLVRDLYLAAQTHAPSKRACYKLLWDWSRNLTYTEFQTLWQTPASAMN